VALKHKEIKIKVFVLNLARALQSPVKSNLGSHSYGPLLHI